MGPRPLAAPLTLLAALLAAGDARADDSSSVESGVNSYEANRFPECVDRFRAMLTPAAPSELKDPELKKRARMYLSACLMAVRSDRDADQQMEQLIHDDYRFIPDRAAFPSKVLDRFIEIRSRLKDEIDRQTLQEHARQEEERRLSEDKARREKERLALLERLAREELLVKPSSRLVAFVPFGAGQFQNRQSTLGWALLGAETALVATSVVSYLIKDSLESQYSRAASGTVDRALAVRDRDRAVVVNYVAFAGFAAIAALGVVHAHVTFVPEFREVRERKIPGLSPAAPAAAPLSGGALVLRGQF